MFNKTKETRKQAGSLEKQVRDGGNEQQSLLNAKEMAISLGNFQSSLNNIESSQIILKTTAAKVREIIGFKAVSFYLVNEQDSSFYQAYCDPEKSSQFIEKEVKVLINDKTFSLALRTNKPTIITSTGNSEQIMLHPIFTSSRTRGMFFGVLEQDRENINDISLLLFTMAIVANSYTLESFGLYQHIRNINKELEANIIKLENSEKELTKANNKLQQDILMRKQAEEALRESEERYRNIFNNSIEGIYQATPDGRYLTVNPAYAHMFGYESPEEMTTAMTDIGEQLYANPEDRTRMIELMRSSDGMVRDFEVQLVRNDGSLFWVSINALMLQNGEGQPSLIEGVCIDITERKLMEEALIVSEEKYRRITENMSDLVSDMDAKGFYKYISPSFRRTLGYDPEDLLGTSVFDRVHPEDLERVATEYMEGISSKTDREVEYRYRHKDGHYIWLRSSSNSFFDDAGEFAGAIINSSDITDRKQIAELVQKSEEKFRKVFHSSPILTAISTIEDGRFLDVNEIFLRMLSLSREEVVGKTSRELGFFAKPAHRQAIKKMTAEKGYAKNIEAQIVAKNGQITEGLFSTEPITIDNEKCWLNVMVDVTEQKRAEELLRESEKRYHELTDLLPISIFEVDSTGRLISFNHNALKVLGYNEEDYKNGLNAFQFFLPEEWRVVGEKMKKLIRGIPIPREEYTFLRKDGSTFTGLVFASPIIHQNKAVGIRGAIIDITERKQAEAEYRVMEKQLLQAQKMEAIGTLAGGVAHDFNNILAAIIGYTELAMYGHSKEKHQRYLQETLKGAERAKNLVKQILTFSRQDDHDKKPLDIKLLLKDAVKFLRASIPATIEIHQYLTDESSNVMADPTQMHQIIMNLCTNATHAMKRTGGVLKIELACIELAPGEMPQHPDLKPGHYVRLTVSDTGHGIDSTHIQRIFDPFFTTKSKDEGTGLGLSVVYGIVKGHDGIIDVYSEPDRGAAFNVYLPRIILTESMKAGTDKPVAGGTERILFVDDEPSLVDLGTDMLSCLGYEVTGVTSSVEALDMFLAEPQRFDLVITDMTIPKMTGIVLSRKILKIRPDIPIILCSGTKESHTEAQAKSLGISAYLTKPLTGNELARIIRDTLDGREKNL